MKDKYQNALDNLNSFSSIREYFNKDLKILQELINEYEYLENKFNEVNKSYAQGLEYRCKLEKAYNRACEILENNPILVNKENKTILCLKQEQWKEWLLNDK